MNISREPQETFDRWLPSLLVVVAIWLVARSAGNVLYGLAFGLTCVYFWTNGFPHFRP